VQSILALSADTLPRVEDVRVDARVIAFGLLLAAATGLLFGLVPALRMAHADPQQDLRGGRGTVGTDGQRLRSALVVAEVALAVLLVIGAGLMARSFLALRSVDAGFEPDRVLTVAMQLNLAGVPEDEMATFPGAAPRGDPAPVRELPGVEEGGHDQRVSRSARMARSPGVHARRCGCDTRASPACMRTRATSIPDICETMGIPLLRGEHLPSSSHRARSCRCDERECRAPALARDEDPIGQTDQRAVGRVVVIGIVGDVRQTGSPRHRSRPCTSRS
jgi:putative ABC transport system permease protein